jgi:ABC-type transport system involved in multi-copper enzyme maturation permease subunit
MSAQTGSMPPPGPLSTRMVDRARFRVDLWRSAPNPLWIRELRQSARLARTPLFLTLLAIGMTLLIAVVGGLVSTWESPATTGVVIFHTFFSLAYFLVTLIGPAVAANSIASEREGRTWEAVLLTGLAPGVIARGKFLSAFTAISMYLVMLAPVGALPFLFGGVTATEVVVAFAGLFLLALLSIAFGLAMSSLMGSMRAAIVITLLLAIPLSSGAFLFGGPFLSFGAHHLWPGVAEGPPIWLPTAYERAPFDLAYVGLLVVLPVLSIGLPAWFLYEVTIANLTSVTDDRSTGLKRWFLVTAPVLTLGAAVPIATVVASDRAAAALLGLGGLFVFHQFAVFLFAGDPIGPSRRVTLHWDRVGAGRFRRFLGPGVMRSALLLLGAGGAGIVLVSLLGLERSAAAASPSSNDVAGVACFGGYALCFHVFVVGLGAFLRSRAVSALSARVLLFAILFAVAVGPWIFAAIAGLVAEHAGREALVVGAPSPFYVFVMLDALGHGSQLPVVVGAVTAGAYALLGLGLLGAAGGRCREIIRKHEALLDETDRILAAEDAAAAAARAPVAADAPVPDAPEAPLSEAAPETEPSPA